MLLMISYPLSCLGPPPHSARQYFCFSPKTALGQVCLMKNSLPVYLKNRAPCIMQREKRSQLLPYPLLLPALHPQYSRFAPWETSGLPFNGKRSPRRSQQDPRVSCRLSGEGGVGGTSCSLGTLGRVTLRSPSGKQLKRSGKTTAA